MTPTPDAVFPPWIWVAFGALLAGLLTADLVLFRAGRRPSGPGRAITACLGFIAISLAFGGIVWSLHGREAAQQYVAAYLVELALSADNLFVFMIVFERFRVNPEHQHRVLFWGILGAIVMRGVFILVGIGVIRRFHEVLLIFGAFLVYVGWKMAFRRAGDLPRPEEGKAARFFHRIFRIRDSDRSRFFISESGRSFPTTLFLALLVIETTDLVFALDSLPAVLAVTTSGFIAITSNVFAVLCLRSLYMALNGIMPVFRHLKAALALILIFIGGKMLAGPWVAVPTAVTLAVIGAVLGGAAVLQAWQGRRSRARSNPRTVSRTPPPNGSS